MELSEEDSEHLRAITLEEDDVQRALLIGRYYQDLDRAERADRHLMYFHIGLLVGIITRDL